MKLSKDKRNGLILVGIVAAVLAVAIWQLLIQTTMAKLAVTQGLGQKAQQRFVDAEEFLRSADLLQTEAASLSNELARVEATMASPVDPYSWGVELIQQASKKHEEVVIPTVTAPQTPSPVQLLADFPYQAITFGVRGYAYFEDLGEFLAEFENSNPYFRTQNLVITPQTRNDQDAGDGTESQAKIPEEMLAFSVDVVALVKPGS